MAHPAGHRVRGATEGLQDCAFLVKQEPRQVQQAVCPRKPRLDELLGQAREGQRKIATSLRGARPRRLRENIVDGPRDGGDIWWVRTFDQPLRYGDERGRVHELLAHQLGGERKQGIAELSLSGFRPAALLEAVGCPDHEGICLHTGPSTAQTSSSRSAVRLPPGLWALTGLIWDST